MTDDPDSLRSAIARDCPHRLIDYDRHQAAIGQSTPASEWLWRIEHAISSQPDLEAQLTALEQLAQESDRDDSAALLEQVSRLRSKAREGLQ